MIPREVIEHRLTRNPHDTAYAIMLCRLAIKELDRIGKIFQEAFDKCEQDLERERLLASETQEKIRGQETS